MIYLPNVLHFLKFASLSITQFSYDTYSVFCIFQPVFKLFFNPKIHNLPGSDNSPLMHVTLSRVTGNDREKCKVHF
jgi:hypothetical protein